MFKRLVCACCAGILLAALGCAQESPEGHWEGILEAGNNRQIGISLDLAKNAEGKWIASMGIPAENITGLVAMDLTVHGGSVKFVAVELRMAKADLTLERGVLKGTLTGPQGTVPLELRRTAKAKVALIPSSPAVSKGLEGDWEGSLQMGSREAPIIVHFRNRPDNTVEATIDTPDTNSYGVPLNDVKQNGRNVEFGIKVAHAGFKGVLNPDNTEISGEIRHEQRSGPLVLRKK